MKHDSCPQWVHNLAKIQTIKKKFREPHSKGLGRTKFWMLKAFLTVIWLQIIWRSCSNVDSDFVGTGWGEILHFQWAPMWYLCCWSMDHTEFSSVQSLSCVHLFATPWTAAPQASLSFTNSWSLLKLMSIKSVMPPNHLILCRPLLLLPPIFPSIRVFSNELVFCIRFPKLVHEPHWVVSSNLIEFITLLWSQMA